jgi:hypothetical protein
MNMIQAAVKATKDKGLPPVSSLLFALLALHNGKMEENVLFCRVDAWIEEYGEVTFPKLEEWANGFKETT